jgi:type IV pilus assembly protein PilC
MEAASQEMLADKLSHLGYYVISIQEKRTGDVLNDFLLQFTKIRTEDMVVLSNQLATMIGAGVSLPNSLKILSEQMENKRLKKSIEAVHNDIRGGATLSEALKKHSGIFSTLFVNMIKAGETAGNLEEVLKQLATFAEKEAELKQKITTALFYPVILLIVGFGVIILVITSVLPAFIKIFTEAHIPLPLPTMILYETNNILRAYWKYFIAAGIALFFGFARYNRSPSGKAVVDRLKLNIPVWGNLIRNVTIARMCRTLAALITAGVPMLQSLETVEATVDNTVIARVIRKVYESVSKGETISEPLRASGEFPPMTVHMIAIGEETGALDTLLNKVADFYELSSDYSIKRLTALLEPLFLIVIGGMVGLVFASIILPIFRMVGTLKK